MRAFLKLDIAQMRQALPALTGEELKVWLAYRLRANRDGEAWPGLETICIDAGVSRSRASDYRCRLIAKGWLTMVSNARGVGGKFGAPRLLVGIPDSCDRDSEVRHGKSAAPQKRRAVKSNSTVTQKWDSPRLTSATRSRFNEVDSEKASKEKPFAPLRNGVSCCSLKSKNLWEFAGLKRIEGSSKALETIFDSYKKNSHLDGTCDCNPVIFLRGLKDLLGAKCPAEVLEKLAS